MSIKDKLEMKSLAGINWRCVTIIDDKTVIHIYFQTAPEKPEIFSLERNLLNESAKQNWGKGISVRFDRSNYGLPDPNRDHIHVYKKNNELFSLNRDGSGHDGTSGIYIPNKIASKIRNNFPRFSIPDNNFIESLDISDIEIINEWNYLSAKQ